MLHEPACPPRAFARPRRPSLGPLVAIGALLLAFAIGGCASQGFVPDEHPMPAARAALQPEFRIFYDELSDYGDWILIEPYGFVFRPRTRFSTQWQPYTDGFWSPSDAYGWIWVSAEPYGWATFHYGRWLNDPYQGWVWIPGVDWAPAWVSWSGSGDYVGWSPMGPSNSPSSPGLGDNFHFVTRGDLGSPDLKSHLVPPERAASLAREASPIENYAQVDRVTVNRGPRIDWVEQAAGPLQRARVQDIAPSVRKLGESQSKPGGTRSAAKPKDAMQVQGEADARRARTIMEQKQSSAPTISRLKPSTVKPEPADSSR
jgi:hypothetical protein